MAKDMYYGGTGAKRAPQQTPGKKSIRWLLGFRLALVYFLGIGSFGAFSTDYIAVPSTQCRSNPVSSRSLPKTGIVRQETFGVFAVKVAKYGAWRPIANSQKPAIGGHLWVANACWR
jgi:hypothetical protein